MDVAAAFYHTLQEQIHDQGLPAYQVPEFAEARAAEMNPEPENWRGATLEEYAAYEHLRDLEDGGIGGRDEPPDHAVDPLIQTAIELGGVVVEAEVAVPQLEDGSAFQALNAIGIEAENLDPEEDPPRLGGVGWQSVNGALDGLEGRAPIDPFAWQTFVLWIHRDVVIHARRHQTGTTGQAGRQGRQP